MLSALAAKSPFPATHCVLCLLAWLSLCSCRIRQWTGDTRGWYANKTFPVLSSAGSAYVFIYAMLTLAFLVLMLFRGWNFQYCSLTGSQKMHKKMLHK
jgi:hypothetical protein